MKGAGVAVAALAAETLSAQPAFAGVDGDVVLGASNSETTPTAIINTAPATDAFRAFSATTGTAIFGSSPTGIGVHGKSGGTDNPGTRGQNTGGGPGVSGDSVHGNGVIGTSTNFTGVIGTSSSTGNGVSGQSQGGAGVGGGSTNGSGVFGSSINSNGVSGLSVNGEGMVGVGPVSGVHGTCAISSGIGVIAENLSGGMALLVSGPAAFSRSGTVVIPSGSKSAVVPAAALSAASLVLALMQNVAGGVAVKAAVPDPANSKFTVFLNKAPASPATATVAWFIVN